MKFVAEGDTLTITLEGGEMIMSLKRKLVIPRSAITQLDWSPTFALTQQIWRLGGAMIPGVLAAGRFRGGGDNYFLYMRQVRGLDMSGTLRAPNILTISTHDFRYKHIVLTCNPEVGAGLVAWWKNGASPVSST
jgi:hypothetical protein